MTGTGTATIQIKDVNDHAPRFTDHSCLARISENAEPNAEVGQEELVQFHAFNSIHSCIHFSLKSCLVDERVRSLQKVFSNTSSRFSRGLRSRFYSGTCSLSHFFHNLSPMNPDIVIMEIFPCHWGRKKIYQCENLLSQYIQVFSCSRFFGHMTLLNQTRPTETTLGHMTDSTVLYSRC